MDKLDEIIAGLKKLEQTKSVSFEDLYVPGFMLRFTDFASFSELLAKGGFKVESQADFEAISEDAWEQHIKAYTRFPSWEEMQAKAVEEFALREIGLG